MVKIFPWMVGGYLYGLRHAPTWRSRAYTLLILCTLMVLAPVFLLLMIPPPGVGILLLELVIYACLLIPMGGLSVLCGRGRRAYMSSTRDAVLIVREVQGQWRVENFFAAHPKRSNTAPLWECTVPALCERADQEGILIAATAMNETLARIYCWRVPGLEPVGAAGMGRASWCGLPSRSRDWWPPAVLTTAGHVPLAPWLPPIAPSTPYLNRKLQVPRLEADDGRKDLR